MEKPEDIIKGLPAAKTTSIMECLTPAQKKELFDLVDLYKREPHTVRSAGWEALAKVYGSRWKRPRMSGRTLKLLIDRHIDGEKSNSA
jgi:hypothetical protein